MKKAYKVCVDEAEGVDLVVFAESRNKAKLIAMSDDSFDDFMKYTDISPTRYPQADYFAEKDPNVERLYTDIPEHARFLRKMGWCGLAYPYRQCARCGLSEFDVVPESRLEAYGGEVDITEPAEMLCQECIEKEKAERDDSFF